LRTDRKLVADSYPTLQFRVNEVEERVSLEVTGKIVITSTGGTATSSGTFTVTP
jgi:hypothetical protein